MQMSAVSEKRETIFNRLQELFTGTSSGLFINASCLLGVAEDDTGIVRPLDIDNNPVKAAIYVKTFP